VRKPDAEIQANVERRLRWSPFLDADDIAVSVTDGSVTLQGTVDTWHGRAVADRHAHQGGARRVRNQLEVIVRRETPLGLRATLVPNRVKYALDAKFSGEEFRRLLELAKRTRDPDRLPPAPKVDLVFRLHNKADRPVQVRLGHDRGELQLSLTGEGVVHVPLGRSFVADFRRGSLITIAPGGDLEIPIRSLEYGFRGESDRWYWTEAGTHMLQATLTWPADSVGTRMHAVAATPIELIVAEN
jgi:hypothetical protein